MILWIKGKGKEMTTTDVKTCLLKKLNVTKTKDFLMNRLMVFEGMWHSFILDLRADMHTKTVI